MLRAFRALRVRYLKRRVVVLEALRQQAEARYDEMGEALCEMKIEMAMRVIEDRVRPKAKPNHSIHVEPNEAN